MRQSFIPRAASVALLLAISASSARGQGVMFAGGAYFEGYSFAEPAASGVKSVSLMTVPFGVEFVPATWARIQVSSAFANGSMTRSDGSSTSLSGLTGTDIQLTMPLVQDRFTLITTFVVPTGKATYSDAEADVAGLLAADLLPFRISNFGSGGALDISGQVAGNADGLNVGLRVGYTVAQQFDLKPGGAFAYRPGNQLYARIAADGDVGEGRASVNVTMYTFNDDKLNSSNLYKSGTRLQAMAALSQPAGHGTMQGYVGVMQRQHGTFVDGSPQTPSQTMLLGGAGFRQSMSFGMIVPSADIRLVSNSDGVGQGYLGSVGVMLEIPVSDGSATLLPLARVRKGNLDVRSGLGTGITGFEIGAGLRFGGAR